MRVRKVDLDNGGKILLPPSALDFLSRMQISWPVFFHVRCVVCFVCFLFVRWRECGVGLGWGWVGVFFGALLNAKQRNPGTNRSTHCGVQEFTAEEGTCNMPYWMMQQLGFKEGSLAIVRQTGMRPGTFAKVCVCVMFCLFFSPLFMLMHGSPHSRFNHIQR